MLKQTLVVIFFLSISNILYSQSSPPCSDSLYLNLKAKFNKGLDLTPTESLYLEFRDNECKLYKPFDSRLLADDVISSIDDERFLIILKRAKDGKSLSIEEKNYYKAKSGSYLQKINIDYILPKEGKLLNVKIVKLTSEYIYLYQLEDTTKSIKRVPTKIIDRYSFVSEFNDEIIKEDSLLFDGYLKSMGLTENSKSAVINAQQEQLPISLGVVSSNTNSTFKTTLAMSGLMLIGAGVLQIIARNIEIPDRNQYNTDEAYLAELSKYADTLDKLSKASTYTLMGGGFFIVVAAINF